MITKTGASGNPYKCLLGIKKKRGSQKSIIYRSFVLVLVFAVIFYCIPSFAVEEVYSEPKINTTSLPDGTVGVPYSASVTATGGLLPYKWTTTGFPMGLTFNSSTGLISGTPQVEGVFSIAFLLVDSEGTSYTRNLALVVDPAPVEKEKKPVIIKTDIEELIKDNPNLIIPANGGTIKLEDQAQISIPANAIRGQLPLEVIIEKMSSPPDIPSGLRLLGNVYRITVGGGSSYDFSSPADVGLNVSLDSVKVGEKADLYTYNSTIKQWVPLGAEYTGKMMQAKVNSISPLAVFAKPIGQQSTNDLTDIKGHWAEASIRKLVNQGAISGYPDGTFGPENLISRAEFTSILVKVYNLTPSDDVSFTDTSNHWAKRSIAAAVNVGIVQGYNDRFFRPDDPINREQMAVMVVKAAALPSAGEYPFFADGDEVSSWARESVASAVHAGIMSGYQDSRFRPQKYATRAEAAAVIAKLK